jgi:hypothetical protein
MSEWIFEDCIWDDDDTWIDVGQWRDDCSVPLPDYTQIASFAFSLDGHDFYVLRLGGNQTLVYDLTTGSWASWDSQGRNVWQANSGFNWAAVLGSLDPNAPATNVILGDDTFSTLWTLTTDLAADEGPFPNDILRNFSRAITGGIPLRSRVSPRCNAVTLTASIGDPNMVATAIQLRVSDNNGATYRSAGLVTVLPEEFNKEVRWRSLGLMRAPGRLFEIVDSGTTVRIDGLDADIGFRDEDAN